MPIRFTKGHGTGNDFVLVADPEGDLDLEAAEVARLCDRRFGVGADGLMRAVRVGADAEAGRLAPASPESWFMDYRNADGSLSEMCGNGIRVFVAFLRAEGLVELSDGASIDVVTRSGVRRVLRTGDEYEVDLGVWRADAPDAVVAVRALEVARPGFSLHVPNPHVVIAVADAAELEAADLGVAPVVSPAPPEGTNVELVHPADPLVVDGVGSIRMRVHERGSGETLSCGTGAAAAALATRHWAGAAAPDVWRVEVPGGVLGVRMTAAEGAERVSLRGPAVLVYSGVVE